MRAMTAATLGVICGASSASNRTGSRLDQDDESPAMVPGCPFPGGGSAAERAVISIYLALTSALGIMESPFRAVISLPEGQRRATTGPNGRTAKGTWARSFVVRRDRRLTASSPRSAPKNFWRCRDR
jgi:hypothetical protein